jgi:hypothetical protein
VGDISVPYDKDMVGFVLAVITFIHRVEPEGVSCHISKLMAAPKNSNESQELTGDFVFCNAP